jgi:hypothetical protein
VSSSTRLSTALFARCTVHSFPHRLVPSRDARLLATQGFAAPGTPSRVIAPHPLARALWLTHLSHLPSRVPSALSLASDGALTHLGVLLPHRGILLPYPGSSFTHTSGSFTDLDVLLPYLGGSFPHLGILLAQTPTVLLPPHQRPPPSGAPNARRSDGHGAPHARLSFPLCRNCIFQLFFDVSKVHCS